MDKLSILYPHQLIEERVYELSSEIENDYFDKQDKDLVLVGILKGSFIFLADLSRSLSIPHTIDFISISSYGESGSDQGEVKLLMDTSQNLAGKNVILVEDIVDSGNTVRYIMDIFKHRHINSIKVCSLVRRESGNPDIDYCGFVAKDSDWLVGYGLDYKEQNRTLPSIFKMNN